MADKSKDPGFRAAALEKMANPERLDELMTVTKPMAWVALTTFGVLIYLILLWGFFGRIPERVLGQGILIPGGSLLQIESGTTGLITGIFVEIGDEVEEGDKICGVSKTEDQFQLKLLVDQLNDLQRDDTSLRTSEGSRFQAEVASIQERRAQADRQRTQLQGELRTAEGAVEAGERLARAGAMPARELLLRKDAVTAARTALAGVDSIVKGVDAEIQQLQSGLLQQQTSREQAISSLKRQIEEKTNSIESSTFVKSAYSGRVTDITVQKGSIIGSELQVVARLERMDDQLNALIFIPSRPGRKVEVGHEVHISPSTVKKEEHGSIKGKLVSRANQPATPAGMLKDLGNETLVQEYSSEGAPFRVDVELEKDPETHNGYAWTSGKGPDVEIFSGTPCEAVVIVGRKRPIDYVIPVFRHLLGL